MARPDPSDLQGYNISIIGNHVQLTDAIRNYVFEKLSKIEHMIPANRLIDVMVTLDTQKLEQSCAIMMNFYHFHIKVSASTTDLYSAIDKASDRLLKLIRRYKTKLQSTRGEHLSTVDIHVNVVKALEDDLKIANDDIVAETVRKESERFELHKVVAQETAPLRTLTQGEAVMKMELSSDPFLIFCGEEDRKIKVIYRRPDENYSIVQVQ